MSTEFLIDPQNDPFFGNIDASGLYMNTEDGFFVPNPPPPPVEQTDKPSKKRKLNDTQKPSKTEPAKKQEKRKIAKATKKGTFLKNQKLHF